MERFSRELITLSRESAGRAASALASALVTVKLLTQSMRREDVAAARKLARIIMKTG